MNSLTSKTVKLSKNAQIIVEGFQTSRLTKIELIIQTEYDKASSSDSVLLTLEQAKRLIELLQIEIEKYER